MAALRIRNSEQVTMLMLDRPNWSTDGADWPHRDSSFFVEAGGLRWHVQQAGSGPDLLLLHGTAASTHSWAGILPLLTSHFRVTGMDLPGHGFTSHPESRDGMGIRGMSRAVGSLVRHLELRPTLVVGHSAGAALAVQLVADRWVTPAGLVGLAPSLSLPSGSLTALASAVAGPVVRTSFAARVVAARMREGSLPRSLLSSTGSRVPPDSIRLYQRLLGHPGTMASIFAMVSQWEPQSLAPHLRGLRTPFLILAGEGDRWIPLPSIRQVASRIPDARVVPLAALGHLPHEEDPEQVARHILGFAREVGAV